MLQDFNETDSSTALSNLVKPETPKEANFTLVDFWAEWCAPCRNMTPIVEQVSQIFKEKGVSFYKVNIDRYTEAASPYGIISIPTFIFFAYGEEKARKVGSLSQSEFAEWIEGLIH